MSRLGAKCVLVVSMTLAAGCGGRGGQDGSDTSVIGGRIADDHPFMAGLTDVGGTESFCGGTYISPKVVVTAAHCVENAPSRMAVSARIRKNSDHGTTTLIPVKAVVAHPKYDLDGKMHNDIALLFLEDYDPATLPGKIIPLELNDAANLPSDTATVIGWGNTTSFGNLFEQELRQVDVPVVSKSKCQSGGDNYGSIDDTQICAGDFAKGGIDSCQGDSGGPLIAKTADGETRLVGVVSWGLGCALKTKMGVYTRVSSFKGWIEETIAAQAALPEKLSASDVQKVASTHCYDGFKDSERTTAGGVTLEVRRGYAADGQFAKADGDAGMSPLNAGTCKVRLPAGNSLTVSMVKSATDGKPLLLATETPSGQTFVSKAGVDNRVNVSCPAAKASLSFRVGAGFGYASLNGEYYQVYAPSLIGLPPGAKKSECLVNGVGATFAVAKSLVTGQSTLYVLPKGTVFGSADGRVFKAEPMAQGSSAVSVDFKATSPKTGTLAVSNGTDQDIHTWRLECSFAFTLKTSSGDTLEPTAAGGLYRFHFAAGESPFGTVKAGDSARFTYTADAPLTGSSASRFCRINDIAVKMTLSGT